MPSFRIPGAIRAQIVPIDSIPFDGFKRDTFLTIVALQEATPVPFCTARQLHLREMRTATGTIAVHVHHECAQSVSAQSGR